MSKRFIALLAALAALALIVAGCGGGSDSTESTSTSSLTKAAFVKQGNAICAKTEKEIIEGVGRFVKEGNPLKPKPLTEKQLAEIAERVLVPKVRRQIDEIRALGIPSGDEQEVEAFFAAAEEALKETEEDPSLFGKGGAGPFAEANKLAREYGLTVCGAEEGESPEEGQSGGE